MIYPVNRIAITQGYHKGKSLDFGWHKAEEKNQDVIACDDGVIYLIQKQTTGGNVVYIKHNGGVVSAYAHLKSICVKKGKKVALGQKIGTMGKSGKASGEHLHFGLYSKGKNLGGNADLDPFKYCLVYPNQKVYNGTQEKYGNQIKYLDDGKVWDKGTYKLLYDKCLRKNHSVGLNTYKVKECPKTFKPYLTSTKPNDIAKVKKGSDVNIKEIFDEKGRIWGAVISGKTKYWLVLCNRDGTPQAAKLK